MVKAAEVKQEQMLDSAIYESQAITVKFLFRDDHGEVHEIQKAFVDPELRNLPADKLLKALPHLTFVIKQLDNGEIVIRAHVKGLGGGPIAAGIAYWTTKGVGYGSYAIVCFFQPHALAEAHIVYEVVEAGAASAYALGMIAPTA